MAVSDCLLLLLSVCSGDDGSILAMVWCLVIQFKEILFVGMHSSRITFMVMDYKRFYQYHVGYYEQQFIYYQSN